MRAQPSVVLISLLLGSVAVGFHSIEFLPKLKQVFQSSLLAPSEPQTHYFAHRGSGRIGGNPPANAYNPAFTA